MKKRLMSKLLATMLVITLTSANFLLLGMYTTSTYAISENVLEQIGKTNNENVEFDVYFKNEQGETTHNITKDITEQNTKMYILLRVKKGYLKDAKIQLLAGQGLSNIRFLNSDESTEKVRNVDTQNNVISLKQIDKNTEVTIEASVEFNKDENYNIQNLSKENIAKLTAVFVNDNGKEKNVTGTSSIRVGFTGDVIAQIEQRVQTYITYKKEQEEGLVIQTAINTRLENNNIPIQETELNVKVPEINGIKPSKVNVNATSTMATNGQDGTNFSKDNWNYDENNNEINIVVKNEQSKDNIVSWKKDCKDEYIITYIFNEKVEGPITLNQTSIATIKAYNNKADKKEISEQVELSNSIGQIVSSKIEKQTNAMSKGNLYAKSEKENTYKLSQIIDIANSELVDNVQIYNKQDVFVDEKNEYPTAIQDTNYAYYQNTTLSKANFERILGTEGKITIQDKNGNVLVEFNKDSKLDENGNYVFNYEGTNVSEIIITSSSPITEGRIILNHQKALKGNIPYSRQQIATFKNIKIETNGIASVNNIEISRSINNSNIELIEPQTRIEANVNTQNLSTVVENENVEMRVVLKTNSIDCDLYKNPTIQIVLPSYIEEIRLNAINLLFSNELKITNYNVEKNEQGEVIITLILEGEETTYNLDLFTKGANIIIDANIKLKELTPTLKRNMKVYVTNQNVTTYENEVDSRAYAEATLNSLAPVGIVTTNTVSSYNNAKEVVTSISSKEAVGKLDLKSNAQTALISMNIINNNENPIENISILGRTPFEGNKEVLTNKDLETTLNAQIKSSIISAGIDSSKVKVYYSQNPEATKDLENANNGWVETLQADLVKSYLIVLQDYTMETGEIIGFGYNVDIPENLSYNKTLASNYAVYYNEQQDEEDSDEVTQVAGATPVALTTGEGIEVETNLSANVEEGASVQEGKRIKYTLSIKNIGDSNANNIKIRIPIPEGTIYTKYMTPEEYEGEEYILAGYIDYYEIREYTTTVEKIEPNQTAILEFELKMDSLYDPSQDANIETYAILEAEALPQSIQTNNVKTKITQGYLDVEMTTFPTEENGLVRENETITYTTYTTNASTISRTNIKVETKVPEGTTFKKAYILNGDEEVSQGVTYDENTKTVTYIYPSLGGQAILTTVLKVETNELEGETQKRFINKSTVTCNETQEVFTTNEVFNIIKLAILNTTFSNNVGEAQVTDKDQIEYYVTIKNSGDVVAKNVRISDYLPAEFVYEGATVFLNGKETTSKSSDSEKAVVDIDIPAGQTAKVTLKMNIESFTDVQYKEAENRIEVQCDLLGYFVKRTTKHTIKATEQVVTDPSNPNDPDNPTIGNKYNISGTAWIDENRNGKKDENEPIIPGMEVMLMSLTKTEAKLVKDESGNNVKQITDEKGNYTFTKLEKGSYIVIFLYDSAEFDVTTYMKEGLTESENSNAITMPLNIDGKNITGAISDVLDLSNSNIYNINIGLYVNQKFDLKLEKTITKIMQTSKNETKEHIYNDAKVAKLDLNGKTVKDTTVVIEYKIKVTNEGAVEGYAKKIVDYIPQDMKFNAELNKDWYVGEDGNLYSTSLANTIIEPGQSKEITLLLTKTMDEFNTGIVNNNAEIYESYNDFGVQDIDSTPGNNIQDEDDQSYADAVLGIKTGEVYLYIVITLITIGIFGIGIYYINKKVLKKIQ